MKKLIICSLLLTACADANISKIKELGTPGHVKCYSGTAVIYEGNSAGRIINSQHSDGYFFIDRTTNKLVEVSGNCVINYTE